jgi:hypothetical protein
MYFPTCVTLCVVYMHGCVGCMCVYGVHACVLYMYVCFVVMCLNWKENIKYTMFPHSVMVSAMKQNVSFVICMASEWCYVVTYSTLHTHLWISHAICLDLFFHFPKMVNCWANYVSYQKAVTFFLQSLCYDAAGFLSQFFFQHSVTVVPQINQKISRNNNSHMEQTATLPK